MNLRDFLSKFAIWTPSLPLPPPPPPPPPTIKDKKVGYLTNEGRYIDYFEAYNHLT